MKKILLFFLIITIAFCIVLRIRYGGGELYPDLSSAAVLGNDTLQEVLSYPEPIGNVAVSRNGRVFFTVHPESRPQGNRLLEYVQGAAVPYPDLTSQLDLYDTVLGIAIDRYDRLWTIDHGHHGLKPVRLLALDLRDGTVLRNQVLSSSIAPKGSFLQDLQVSADGKTIVIADASLFRKQPALIVYDVETGQAQRRLEMHPSVAAEHYTIQNQGRPMTYIAGLYSLRGGVDGIALGPEWLYFGALNGSGLYRVKLADLRDMDLSESNLARRVERYSDKPLSDGFSVDNQGHVYMAAIEHNAVFRVDTNRQLSTLLQSDKLRWPDGLSFGPDGWLYVSDSALSDAILQPKEHIKAQGPYSIYRFRPGTDGTPGQ